MCFWKSAAFTLRYREELAGRRWLYAPEQGMLTFRGERCVDPFCPQPALSGSSCASRDVSEWSARLLIQLGSRAQEIIRNGNASSGLRS